MTTGVSVFGLSFLRAFPLLIRRGEGPRVKRKKKREEG